MHPEDVVARLSDRMPEWLTEHDQQQLDVFESECNCLRSQRGRGRPNSYGTDVQSWDSPPSKETLPNNRQLRWAGSPMSSLSKDSSYGHRSQLRELPLLQFFRAQNRLPVGTSRDQYGEQYHRQGNCGIHRG